MRPKSKKSSPGSSRVRAALGLGLQGLLVFVVLGVVYRYCWIDTLDPFKCSSLLNKGQWRDPGPRWSSRNPFQNWQPPGCIMHEYKRQDIQECFKKRRLVFIGDSTTRQIFWAVAKKMDSAKAEIKLTEIEILDPSQKHQDIEFRSDGVNVQFIWDPFLNSTGLEYELRKFKADPSHQQGGDQSAGLILLGSPGLWFARHDQENYHKNFRDAIDGVIPFMDHPSDSHSLLPLSTPYPSRQQAPNLLLLAPIQVPRYQSLSPSREATITPEKIDQMNNYVQQVSAHSGADVVWSYTLMTESGNNVYEESGLHVTDNVAHRKADVLLNLRCNADATSRGYAFDRTCCSNYTRPGGAQWISILLGMLVLPALYLARQKHIIQISKFLPQKEILNASMVFGLIICYCFYADRTQIFEKEQKQFRKKELLAACTVILTAGFVSIRRNKTKGSMIQESSHDYGFLPRDQTDEWKGCMQLLILVYQFTNGSKTLWTYETVRVFAASYLFMTGFGHTIYFLKYNDYSLQRVAGFLVRLNLLSCVLPYMMRTDYLFYYFAPLVSFWFLIIWLTLKIGHDKNSNLIFLMGKVLLSALIATAFTMIPGILEFISFLLHYTCAISWNMQEWRHRTFLDMYIVYIGMITATLYHRYSLLKYSSLYQGSDSYLNQIINLTIAYPRLWKAVAVFLSIDLLPTFCAVAATHTSKQDFNWWHPYLSCWPIICYITLRNSHRILRNYHSTLFAWLGRCSLETYILHHHIWLAGDTKGILRLGLFNRWVEAAIISILFLWISHRTADVTQKITTWVVGEVRMPYRARFGGAMGEKGSPHASPRTRRGESSSANDNLGDLIHPARAGRGEWIAKFVMMLREDLRWRLGFILLVMWFGNVTYR